MLHSLPGGYSTDIPQQIYDLIADGALFVINHSAGKDSQAMAILVRAIVPADQILVIHADLGRVEWPGNIEHIQATIGDLSFLVCQNENKDFIEMTRRRGSFPITSARQCTADLKRDPIEREVRRFIDANPRFGRKIVTCMGIRAQESSKRKGMAAFTRNGRGSKAGRDWYHWLPIHDMTLDEVWATIKAAGQKRHYAYDLGMTRLSCCFCIMGSASDLTTAAKARPALYREYVELERELDNTLVMPRKGKDGAIKRFLPEITGIAIDEAA